VVGGFFTHEIARAYLKSEATIAQRIVRAKRTLAEAHVPFQVPRGAELAERLASALQAAIAAYHARAPTAADTDWARITALYF